MIEAIDHGAVRELRLARPPVNALETEGLRALRLALATATGDGARAVILSGQPGMFSAGLDIPHLLRQSREQMLEFWEQFFGTQHTLAAAPMPVVAAITGHSPAGGAVLALYCDYRVMAAGAYRIGLNEVQVGLFPGPLIHAALKRVVGARHAERLLTGGLMLSAEEALRVGLVDQLAAEAQVVPAALQWANTMVSLPAQALARTRRMVRTEIIELTAHFDATDFEAMNAAWFSQETQATLRQLAARLKR